jgi:hypothetical protein
MQLPQEEASGGVSAAGDCWLLSSHLRHQPHAQTLHIKGRMNQKNAGPIA